MGAFARALNPPPSLASRLWRAVLRRMGYARPPSELAEPQFDIDRIAHAIAAYRPTPQPTTVGPTVHLIGTLGAGGAERQLCNFVIAARRMGLDHRVLLLWPPDGDRAHYLPLLERENVPVSVAGASYRGPFRQHLKRLGDWREFLNALPLEIRDAVCDVLGELAAAPPHVLHCWLDGTNIVGGIAALVSDARTIVLSTRNVSPTHFPYLDRPYYLPLYRLLAQSERVRFINNSAAGAADYAQWLGLEQTRIAVVVNGLDVDGLERATPHHCAEWRRQHGIPVDARLLAGAFRFSEEKQPELFLDVAMRLLGRYPDLHVAIAGIGPLESLLRERVHEAKLETRVHFVGRQADIAPLFSTAVATLLCSRKEGTPNVLLESQWLGCPVVSTKAGGAAAAVSHGRTGFLAEVGDADALAEYTSILIDDLQRRNEMAAAGPLFIEEVFSVPAMVERTLAVYGGVEPHRPSKGLNG